MSSKQPTGLGRGLGELFQRTTLDADRQRAFGPATRPGPTPAPPDSGPAFPSLHDRPTAPSGRRSTQDAPTGTSSTDSHSTPDAPTGTGPAHSSSTESHPTAAPVAHPPTTARHPDVQPTPTANAPQDRGYPTPTSVEPAADTSRTQAAATPPPEPTTTPGAQFPTTTPGAALPATTPTTAYLTALPLDSIEPNPDQPRTVFDPDDLRELADSIEEVGLLQPIVVRPLDQGRYELVMGERRWRAAQLAGLDPIPSIVRPTEEADRLRDALLENIHRVQLNPLEEAAAYQQLLTDFGCTQDELAARVKKSRPQISNTLRLLKLPFSVQRRLAAGVLSAGHARALLSLDDAQAMERLAQRIVAEGLSVRATEELTTLSAAAPAKPRATRPRAANPRALELAQTLSDQFDTRVRVDIGAAKGRITIEFAGNDDLARILTLLTPAPA